MKDELKASGTDLMDQPWAFIEPLIPATKPGGWAASRSRSARGSELDPGPESDGLSARSVAAGFALQEQSRRRLQPVA